MNYPIDEEKFLTCKLSEMERKAGMAVRNGLAITMRNGLILLLTAELPMKCTLV